MAFKKMVLKTKRQEIYEEIKRHIICGELAPGEQVNVGSIAGKIGVSLMPVREAFLQLQAEEIVQFMDKRKIFINYLTAEELEEFSHMRCLLEGRLVELACKTEQPDAVDILTRRFRAMEKTQSSVKDYLISNYEFHFQLYSFANAAVCLHMVEEIWARVGPYMFLHTKEFADMGKFIDFHRDIYDAFVLRDEQKIKSALVRDIREYTDFLLPKLRSQNLTRDPNVGYSIFLTLRD